MTPKPPEYFTDLEQCVDALIRKVGKKVVIAGGFGRPAHIFNELFKIHLGICRWTADPELVEEAGCNPNLYP